MDVARWDLEKKFFLTFYLFLRETETECEQGRGREREREGVTESEAGSRLRAVSTERDEELEPTNREIMTWAEVGRLTDRATPVPLDETFRIRVGLKLNGFYDNFFPSLEMSSMHSSPELIAWNFRRKEKKERTVSVQEIADNPGPNFQRTNYWLWD